MKAIIILLVVLSISLTIVYSAETYDTRYDSLDIEAILSNDRVLTNYIKCLMDKGPCTKEGRALKKDLPDALQTNCNKCTESQKKIVRKAIKHIQSKRPDDWKNLQTKFDPKGIYQENFQKFLNEQ